ncbi:MAG TPA: LLM class flavin-dependent oxidoreductase [Actinophytocola sp.]|uniref:LLM class flavin-dependent oxidoreductase n=1 Tax=Actinophytocola sp. TaxID=1872138 RepID=UPI002DDD2871|nr:LLM class flavin-dependent oxidoreductase [Actinophytocola sp.]HEV2779807.1 LLM class flavin-dependent oxidoreductase [Actinophytocola sp.]
MVSYLRGRMAGVRYSINVPNFGELADPRVVADLAVAAEEAGWDGLFVWDHVHYRRYRDRPFADPWIVLAAAGMVTTRLRLGPLITPVARRRPVKLAREITTLDVLTGGRLVLGVGLGGPAEDEFGSFGEPTDLKMLAERLDEGLEAVMLLLSGEPVSYHGRHVTLDDVRCLPTPVQRPRVPVWVAGRWPTRAPFRRAVRWDGAVPLFPGYAGQPPPSVADVRELAAFLAERRAADGRAGEPFDLVVGGRTGGDRAREIVAELAEAGATWWDERMPFDDTLDRADGYRKRIEQGPPRV